MSSTTPTPSTFIASGSSRRMLLWIGAVLAIGVAIFFGAFFGGGSSQDVHPGGKTKVQSQPAGSPAARGVARTFLETAVARKHLDVAYRLVGPWLKGIPRAKWIKGNNPVTYFPAANLKTAPFKVLSSTKNALLLEVGPLVPAKGTKYKARLSHGLSFKLEVDRIRGTWLVNYFMPNVIIPGSFARPGPCCGPDQAN